MSLTTPRKDLTAEFVRNLLDYDPVTGALSWIEPTDRSPSEGGKAGALGRAGKSRVYRRFLQIGMERHLAHRIIWLHAMGEWPKGYLVPKNEDYDDLRLDNWSDISSSEMAKRGGPRRSNTSGFRGVTWAKDKNRWLAYITHNYKRTYIGYFKTIEDAVEARDNAVKNLGLLPVWDKEGLEKRAAEVNRDAKLRVFWRRLMKQTAGITEWQSYDHFYKDVGELPEANGAKFILIPMREQETIGPGNFQWKKIESPWDRSTKEGKMEYARAHRAENRNSYRDKELRKNFGISLNDYQSMDNAQGGVCGSCGEPETQKHYGNTRRLAVDHCHSTGEIRGLLCSDCNKGLGHFKDSPTLLRKAADYLERHAAKSGASNTTNEPIEGARGASWELHT